MVDHTRSHTRYMGIRVVNAPWMSGRLHIGISRSLSGAKVVVFGCGGSLEVANNQVTINGITYEVRAAEVTLTDEGWRAHGGGEVVRVGRSSKPDMTSKARTMLGHWMTTMAAAISTEAGDRWGGTFPPTKERGEIIDWLEEEHRRQGAMRALEDAMAEGRLVVVEDAPMVGMMVTILPPALISMYDRQRTLHTTRSLRITAVLEWRDPEEGGGEVVAGYLVHHGQGRVSFDYPPAIPTRLTTVVFSA
jgi:hypothetical protein